jgi:hypothetical protein
MVHRIIVKKEMNPQTIRLEIVAVHVALEDWIASAFALRASADAVGATAPRNDGVRFPLPSPRHCERSEATRSHESMRSFRSQGRSYRWTCTIIIRLLLGLASLAGFAAAVHAQQPVARPGENIDWPSPDGKFAFLTFYSDDPHTIDLIDKTSGKKLQRIAEGESSQTTWHLLWAPDSERFALMTRFSHPIQGVDVYFLSGETFRKIDLPELPEANIPEALKHGRKFPHIAGLNWQEAKRWTKDGSLVVNIDTMIDGDGASITATRTVMLGFDRAGKARIVKSTIKYESERD